MQKHLLSASSVSVFGWSRKDFPDHPNPLDGGQRPFMTIYLRVKMVTEDFSAAAYIGNIYIAFKWLQKFFNEYSMY